MSPREPKITPISDQRIDELVPPRRNWRNVVAELERNPGVWHDVAQDVPVSTASRLRREYGVETRLEGVNSATARADHLYARALAPDGPTADDQHLKQLYADYLTHKAEGGVPAPFGRAVDALIKALIRRVGASRVVKKA